MNINPKRTINVTTTQDKNDDNDKTIKKGDGTNEYKFSYDEKIQPKNASSTSKNKNIVTPLSDLFSTINSNSLPSATSNARVNNDENEAIKNYFTGSSYNNFNNNHYKINHINLYEYILNYMPLNDKLKFFLLNKENNNKLPLYTKTITIPNTETPVQDILKQFIPKDPNNSTRYSLLTYLDLSQHENITDDDLSFIAANFIHLKTLILCDFTEITDDGLKHLRKIKLQYLNLRDCNQITEEGLNHLLEMPLQYLNFSYCDLITDAAIKKIAANLKNLKILDFSFCREITDETIREIYYNLKNLILLTLLGCPNITNSILNLLRQARPQLQIITKQTNLIYNTV